MATKKPPKDPMAGMTVAGKRIYNQNPLPPPPPNILPGQVLNPEGKGGFQKGISGNPNGLMVSEYKKVFRELGAPDIPKVYHRLMEVMTDCDDATVVLKAISIWLDRMFGRIPVATEAEVEPGLQLGDPGQMTTSDMRKQMGLMIELMKGMIPKDVIEGRADK